MGGRRQARTRLPEDARVAARRARLASALPVSFSIAIVRRHAVHVCLCALDAPRHLAHRYAARYQKVVRTLSLEPDICPTVRGYGAIPTGCTLERKSKSEP